MIEKIIMSDIPDYEKKKKVLELFKKNKSQVVDELFTFLISNKKRLSNSAFNILEDIMDSIVVEKAISYFSDNRSSVRSIIYELLLNIGKKNNKNLIKHLSNPNYHIRKLIIDIFANNNILIPDNIIKNLINDENPNIRYATVEYILKSSLTKYVAILKERLKREDNEWVIFAIIEAIGKLGTNNDIKDILNLPVNSTILLKGIISVISKLGTSSQLNLLLFIFLYSNSTLKREVIEAIYNLIVYNNISGEDILQALKNNDISLEFMKSQIKDFNDKKTLIYSLGILSQVLKEEESDFFIQFFDIFKEDEYIVALLNILLKYRNKKFKTFYKKYLNSNNFIIKKLAEAGMEKYNK